VDDAVKKAWSGGGTIALPKMPIPGVGWLAYCKDTEGNIFGLMQADPKGGVGKGGGQGVFELRAQTGV